MAEPDRSLFGELGNHPTPAASNLPVGHKLSDIHEGWQGLHRVDPPPPAATAFRRSASDVTLLQTGGRAILGAHKIRDAAAAALLNKPAAVGGLRVGGLASAAGMSSEDAGRGHLRDIAIADYELAQQDRGRRSPQREEPDASNYRHMPTDIHLHSFEDTRFRQQEAMVKFPNHIEGHRPKYGRRKSLTLFASDFDLIPSY